MSVGVNAQMRKHVIEYLLLRLVVHHHVAIELHFQLKAHRLYVGDIVADLRFAVLNRACDKFRKWLFLHQID
ncbi:hypothetical protein LSTR_LSTR016651 [Laodelphax striatellus]|uniref:Uncharacterized protein n=1 Tax=Laodelphax striatellus TaxID=195883 RepID=A0A482WL21_LAOST|nr:hypothetical protein LSTR_LSTR016651 [Laodelphax striatellus]